MGPLANLSACLYVGVCSHHLSRLDQELGHASTRGPARVKFEAIQGVSEQVVGDESFTSEVTCQYKNIMTEVMALCYTWQPNLQYTGGLQLYVS
jgi:hypothetical protein